MFFTGSSKVIPSGNLLWTSSTLFHTVSLLDYTPTIMDAVLNETKVYTSHRVLLCGVLTPTPSQFWGSKLALHSGGFISYDVEPFLPSIFSHAPENSSAYPPSRARGLLPLNIYYAYTDAGEDETFWDAARQSAAQLTAVAVGEGQDVADATLYGNYAIFDTPLERIFGDNVDALKALKAKYDPEGVMALAGGWKFS